jgi:hypothetical protein
MGLVSLPDVSDALTMLRLRVTLSAALLALILVSTVQGAVRPRVLVSKRGYTTVTAATHKTMAKSDQFFVRGYGRRLAARWEVHCFTESGFTVAQEPGNSEPLISGKLHAILNPMVFLRDRQDGVPVVMKCNVRARLIGKGLIRLQILA